MNKLTTLLITLLTTTFLVGDVNAGELEKKKDRETSIGLLQNNSNSYQFNIESKVPSSFGFHYGGSYSNHNGDGDFLINLGLAGNIKKGKFLLSPYIFGAGSLDFSKESTKQDNLSLGLKLGYDVSKRVNAGFDLRRTNYSDGKLKDSFFSGIFLKIK